MGEEDNMPESADGGDEANTHYFCEGSCGARSDTPQKCGTSGCNEYGNSMKECDCTDGNHIAKNSGGYI